jgi:hypothetical protein
MTKVRDLTRQNEGEEKRLKPIEFVKESVRDEWSKFENDLSPKDWDNIELVAQSYCDNLDLMIAFDDIRGEGVLYLGHFNDGVVE